MTSRRRLPATDRRRISARLSPRPARDLSKRDCRKASQPSWAPSVWASRMDRGRIPLYDRRGWHGCIVQHRPLFAGQDGQVGLQDLVGGSFIQPFISALPHFAGGGDVTAGNPIMVGRMVRSHSFRGLPAPYCQIARWAGRRGTHSHRCMRLERPGGDPRSGHEGSATHHCGFSADPTSRGEAEATGPVVASSEAGDDGKA